MRPTRRGAARRRRGKILVFSVLLMPVILGFAGLSADLGVIALARSQLMTVADSAALAGAEQLASAKRIQFGYVPTTEMGLARTSAHTIGQLNYVLNTLATVDSQNDVSITEFDYNSATGKWAAAASPQQSRYNSVTVNAQRSSSRGGVVPAFFSVIWGGQGTAAAFASTATVQNYSITGYKTVGNLNAQVLPIAFSYSNYQALLQAQTSSGVTSLGTLQDNYTYNPPTTGNPYGTVTSGSDGVYESQLYPVANNAGNWGTVRIGVDNNGTPTLGQQISNGITPAQLANVQGGLQLSTATNPPSLQLPANPGLSSAIGSDLASIIGKPVTVVLYSSVSGSGNNASYTIVGFGAVRIVAVGGNGNNMYAIVQPALVNDGTAIPGTIQSSWTAGGLVVLHLTN